MYSLKSSICKVKGRNGRWLEPDLSAVVLRDLFISYARVVLVLENPILTGDIGVDLEEYRLEIITNELTVTEWLATLGSRALTRMTAIPTINIQHVEYSDARYSNYEIEPCSRDSHPLAPIEESIKIDLMISRAETDFELFHRNCLVSINGMFHLTSETSYGVQVIDGNQSSRIAGKNECGILSFRKVGRLWFIPIEESMIYRQSPNQKLYNKAYIRIPHNIANKAVMLVLGGHLHIQDPTYRQVGDDLFMIDFNNYPFVQRYFETKDLIDLSSLNITEYGNGEQIDLAEFFNEDTITKYLTLSQSFFVVVDTPDLFVQKTAVQESDLPGVYYTNENPTLPLFGDRGNHLPYWKHSDDGKYVMSVSSNYNTNYLFETTDWQTNQSIANNRVTTDMFRLGKAYLHEIGRDI